ncbi:MAG: 16S rRNA (cytidine(1402)-2'-O)-methyltransferase [Rhodospirillales bacterium]|jgi:16S rRNA (cytidine1402-2'-O)-methyltransferase|nr:16S rRNA (cytidine(1402)-2'-O)-methyltransferase [Rhodospirillales bacterium]MBT4039317.1 16S rRNA (cytidine(1402)-2'-O)-methyltransferase [Rhodospirillales bacterium]MBT4626665.1 16S rRNA (cytidine(1402)-2'-O)-methyltransferase [Rhodospirillales bacterium]MBT5352018.1 16S rRNA (cytidine(1402)-2'-O)-methyltransferase [Rhodospirillales bacterium]MBT5519760.1 16S rRNA (cytidine(1402)-2'-O)-methyltransferase [Rhodospirillales bacterium]
MKSQSALPGTLYVVATPIGNASDITLRALDILKTVQFVACEDTRVTAKLLSIHGLKISLSPYHEHNAAKVRPAMIERLKNGDSMALVSDAGTPLVSDPGYKLVQACLEEGLHVTTLPGASAVLCALVLSGLPTDRFLFEGFLPSKSGARLNALKEIASIPATLVFMESPRRLATSLSDMATVLGDRRASVSREITKMYEETRRGTLTELSNHYVEAGAPKGEAMVVVAAPEASPALDDDAIDNMLRVALAEQSVRDAVRSVTDATGLGRQQVYQRALLLSKDD